MPAVSQAQDRKYVAGLFDGEGHVSIKKHLKNMTIGITNGYLPILEKLQEKYGGVIQELKRYKDNHSRTWQWIARNKETFDNFLNDVDMDIRIKIPQVFAAECFATTMLKCGGNRRKERLSPLAWAVRREALENLRRFNRAS